MTLWRRQAPLGVTLLYVGWPRFLCFPRALTAPPIPWLQSIDGGHTHPVARADLVNMRKLLGLGLEQRSPAPVPSVPSHILVMDDAGDPCDSIWCMGPRAAWDEAVNGGWVMPLRPPQGPHFADLQIVVGKYA